MEPWNTLLKMAWAEQDKIGAMAREVERRHKERTEQLAAEAMMTLDGLRAAYRRLQGLEARIRESCSEKLPEKNGKTSGVGDAPSGPKNPV